MKWLRFLLLSLGAVVALSSTVSAGTFYVSTTGNDTNPGTSAQPWRTIQRAVNNVNPGDTILVRSGSYAGCRIGRSGTAAAVCTLKADTGATVLINALSSANRHTSLIEVENFDAIVSYWIIDGFELAGAPRYGCDLRNTDHVTVQNCNAHNSASTGIFLAFCYNPVIQNNESAFNGEHGIYQSNSGDFPTIRGNNLHHNFAAGVHMNGDRNFTPGDGIISFALVEKNVVWENGTGGGSGINCDGVSDSIIRNNLLYNNHASGISLYAIDGSEGSSRNKIYNNTIVMPAAARWCINIPPSSEGQANPVGNKIKNNILYNPHSFRGSITIYSPTAASFESDYNIVVSRFSADDGNSNMSLALWQGLGFDQHSKVGSPDVLFVNAPANDYHLKSGSPAIDAGTFLAEVNDDLAGTVRPQGAAHDAGAYESGGGGPGPVPAPVADFTASPLTGTVPLSVQFTDQSTGGPTTRTWDFGDGSISTLTNPSHTYLNAGSFTVSLTVSNTSGQNTRTRTGYVNVGAPPAAPVADFTASPLTGTVPLSVQFTDQSTGGPTTRTWDFGDGGISTLTNPSHTYLNAGSFTVSLTVSNTSGQNTRTRTGYINVGAPPAAPVADFAASPLTGTVPLSVQFTDQSTGGPTTRTWDFGDGSISTLTNPSHTYLNAGSFTVNLTVSNTSGQNTRTRTGYINVGAPAAAPVADFTASPLTGTVPLSVQFTDQSTGGPTTRTWDFGDGSISMLTNPSHTYLNAGSFAVSLTVSNTSGQNTRTRTGYINVGAPAARDFFCISATVTTGTVLSGDHTSVHASDNNFLRITAKKLEGRFGDLVTYVYDTGFGSISTLVITSESRVSATPQRQRLMLLNTTTLIWDVVDDRNLTSSGDTTTLVTISNPSRYLSPSGQVQVRIRTGDSSNAKWKHSIDLVKVTATP